MPGARCGCMRPAGALGDEVFERDAVDDIERVDDVALGLGHLLAVLVADEAGDVDVRGTARRP